MWAGGQDVNDNGESVRLYQPILNGFKGAPKDERFTGSYVGGVSNISRSTISVCPSCDQPLHLLVHLHVPGHQLSDKDRPSRSDDWLLQVTACNRAACINQVYEKARPSKLLFGGQGVIQSVRVSIDLASCMPVPETSKPSASSPSHDENMWTTTEGENVNLDDLEAKLAAMEASEGPSRAAPSAKAKLSNQQAAPSDDTRGAFPCFSLASLLEPVVPLQACHDEDDVGLSTRDNNDKIQAMLARYMAEEDDEEILAALRGSEISGGGSISGNGGAGKGERDERLSATDWAMRLFSDRLKRCPRQVLRYAPGGEPLWSIPTSTSENVKRPMNQRGKAQHVDTTSCTQPIPNCACGAPRRFVFQVLPSLLHVLKVDQQTSSTLSTSDASFSLADAFSSGGLDFGNLAIYACADLCPQATGNYVVWQAPVDDGPVEVRWPVRGDGGAESAVVIPEGSEFNNENDEWDDDADEEVDGDNMEDDDDR